MPLRTTRALAFTLTFVGVTTVACDPNDHGVEDHDLLEADLDEEDSESEELALVDPASIPSPLSEDEPVLDRPDFDLTASPDVQAYVWKGWISEEGPASTCATGQVVSGYDCDGGSCDNQRLECHAFGGTLGDRTWSNWFSEEAPNNFYLCPGNSYVSGVTCSGGNCDNVSLECTTTTLAKTNCAWAGPYSEEQPAYLAPAGKAIAGMWCTGGSCDNHYYWVCSV